MGLGEAYYASIAFDPGPTQELVVFEAFPKIPRYKRDVVISEKIDGTNAQIYITKDGRMFPGKRSGWCDTKKDGKPVFFPDYNYGDNFGFAAWCAEHKDELLQLGPGRHFGEWFGCGIQRGYGLKEKRFALFNTARWNAENQMPPACCTVVPVLYKGVQDEGTVNSLIDSLIRDGSRMVPGFMDPEGVVIYHCAARAMYKVTCKNDEKHKGE